MLGFTLPLLLVVGVESVVGVLMLCPKPVNQPAIQLARASHTQVPCSGRGQRCHALPAWPAARMACCPPPCPWPAQLSTPLVARPPAPPLLPANQVGSTIFHTLAGVLVLLLASPLYDGIRLYYFTKDKPEQAALDLRCARLHGCGGRPAGPLGGQGRAPRRASLRSTSRAASPPMPPLRPRSEHEARIMVSAVLTGAALALLFFLRKLGRALSECERMSVSEAALLKQVPCRWGCGPARAGACADRRGGSAAGMEGSTAHKPDTSRRNARPAGAHPHTAAGQGPAV